MRREGGSVGPNCSVAATKLRGPTDHPHRTLTICNSCVAWQPLVRAVSGQKMVVFAHFLSKIGYLGYFRVRNIG